MARAKQLTISHENRPGMVAKIAKVLGDAKVNILNCLTTTSGTEGVTHLVVDKVNKAKKALANAGLVYIEADVLCVELPNTPGALAKFTGKLAEIIFYIILRPPRATLFPYTTLFRPSRRRLQN